MEDAEDEWNLNSIDDCVSYLESHFPMEEALSLHCNADMFTRVARWYVEALQKRTPRAPLAHHSAKEIISPSTLGTKAGRRRWLQVWLEDRKRVFLPKKK